MKRREWRPRPRRIPRLTTRICAAVRSQLASSVLAWAYLSCEQSSIYWLGFDPTPGRLAAAKDAVDHALALDPNLPETHLAVGYYRYYGQRDFTGALAEFQQAEQGLPNNVYM